MANKLYDDSNWREEYKAYTSNEKHLELLENGPHSLSSSWILGALYNKWKKMKGYDKLDPKDNEGQLQSSMKEWEESVKKYENPDESDIIEQEKDLPQRPEEQIYDELNSPDKGQ